MTIHKEVSSTIQEMVEKIVAEYAPEKIILFGSYAYGTPREDSDIDLFIIKETSEKFLDRCIEVRRILSDPKRITPLEVFVLTPEEVRDRLRRGDQFIKEIVERGRVLHAAA